MVWLLLLLVLAAAATVAARCRPAAPRARRLDSVTRFRLGRRAADEDVTRLGEELAELHVDTLATELDADMHSDYQRALDCYERAKSLLRATARLEDVAPVTRAVADGRFAMACVLARRDGEARPVRRPPCFFDPRHGPAVEDLTWAPPGGTEREIGVCRADAHRIAGGDEPEVRLVRLGDRKVLWYVASAPAPDSPRCGSAVAVAGARASVVRGAGRLTRTHLADARARAGLGLVRGGGFGV